MLAFSSKVCFIAGMEDNIIFKYRGKTATAEDIEFINKLIAANPRASRFALSKELCRAWKWIQANGALRDMVARGFMLGLHRAGHIILPPQRLTPKNPFVHRTRPAKIEIDQTEIKGCIADIYPVQIELVRNTPRGKLFNSLIEYHHYLGYCHPVGEQLKYLISVKGRPAACFAWSSAPRHIGARDRYIGWNKQTREQNLHYIAYNNRFLILQCVKIPHLASHLLGMMVRRISNDWKSAYNHPLFFLETFVNTQRFAGTCYKAANWQYLGKTTGRGKNDNTGKPNRSIKAVWGYPLSSDFRKQLKKASS